MVSRRAPSTEESLFDVADLGFELPPSPLEKAEEKRQAKELERQQAIVRTPDERAASANEIIAEWIQHVKSQGLSETDIPTEIKSRVGRSVRSLIKKEYLYKEIVFALSTFTVRDLRNRKYTPKTGNIEIYARQYRGESLDEREANDAAQEKLRQEALAQGKAPTSGTGRQNRRDASVIAVAEAAREFQALKSSRQGITYGAPPLKGIEK